jgi:hypothetical protein
LSDRTLIAENRWRRFPGAVARLEASPGDDGSAIAFLNRCTRPTVLATDPEIALLTAVAYAWVERGVEHIA